MAAVIARITRLGAESTGRDGSQRLKHWCQAPQVRAANLVVSALRESSVFWIHRSDLCGLQRRESLGFAGIEAESDMGPGVISACDQPSALESRAQTLSYVRDR